MASNNTKINGKGVNDTKTHKLKPTATRFDKNGILEQGNLVDNNKSFGELPDIIVPEKRIFTSENDFTTVADFTEGLNHNKKVDEDNAKLYENRDPETDKIDLLGPKVLVRMFKLKLYNKKGMYTGGRTHEVLSKSEMRKNIEQLPDHMQFQDKGVVIQVSDNCTESFKAKVTPGTVIEVDPTAFNPGRMQRWIHKDNVTNDFDNYFIIPEFVIENIVKQ